MNSHLYVADEEGVETILSSLPGTILDGGYEIQELLSAEPHAAVFRVRILGDRYTRAEVMFFHLNERDAAAQIECWRNAKAVRSPYLNAPLAFGMRRFAEDTMPYVVQVKADETLAEVIRERPLKAGEAMETMLCVARALVDLHTSGLIHGLVTPEHILSIGQDIKLSGHTARPAGSDTEPYACKPAYLAPESLGCNSTPAADVWCLGASLVEVFQQKACDDKYAGQLESLPSPFAYIAKRCLETNAASRATASEAVDMLTGRIPAEAPKAAPLAAASAAAGSGIGSLPVAEIPVIKTVPAAETSRKVSETSIATPSTGFIRSAEATHVDWLRSGASRSERRPIWLYAGGLLLLVALALWLGWPRHSGPAAAQLAATGPSAPTSVPQTSVAEKSSPQTFSPQLAAAKAETKVSVFSEAKTPPDAAVRTPVAENRIWRVVVYTYHRRDEAEEMAGSINHRHSKLDAKVFVPQGRSASYLVTVGAPMTRAEAVRYQSLAIHSGMPRDTYIQNYRSE